MSNRGWFVRLSRTHEVDGCHPPGRRKEPEMMLKDKVAVIYGGGGAIGGAVARAFVRSPAAARAGASSRSMSTNMRWRALSTSAP